MKAVSKIKASGRKEAVVAMRRMLGKRAVAEVLKSINVMMDKYAPLPLDCAV